MIISEDGVITVIEFTEVEYEAIRRFNDLLDVGHEYEACERIIHHEFGDDCTWEPLDWPRLVL